MIHPLLAAQEHEKQHCRETLLQTMKGRFVEAVQGCEVTNKLIMWLALQRGGSDYSFQEITQFIEDNPTWPNQAVLKRSAERAITASIPTKVLVAWFQKNPPMTTDGVSAYAKALKKSEQPQVVKAYVKKVWVEKNFSKRQQKEFLKRYQSI